MKIMDKDAIAVYDSSIDWLDGSDKTQRNTYRGFEIVTRPLNLENMIDFIKRLTEKRHEKLRSWHVGTAGIHIHVARNRQKKDRNGRRVPNLTEIEIGKLLMFVNEPKNRHMIKHIARRYNAKYARFQNKRIIDCRDKSKDCHYDAINTNKDHTIEFRIFRGTLNQETILSYLQFIYAAIAFVRITPANSKSLSFIRFLEWLSRTPKSQYRHLKKRLETYGKSNQLELGGEEA